MKLPIASFAFVIFLAACGSQPSKTDMGQPEDVVVTEVPDEKYTWDLSDLYPSPVAWTASRDQVAKDIKTLKNFQGTLGQSPKALLSASDNISAVYKEAVRLLVYATLKADENTKIAENEERRQLASVLLSDLSAAVSWYRPELLDVGEVKIRRFLTAESGLKKHQSSIEDTLRQAPHTLAKEVESVLAKTGKVINSPSDIYNILANANLPWEEVTLSDGETLLLSQAGYGKGRQAPNRADRKQVFDTFWGTWKNYEATMGTVLNAQVQGLVVQTDIRKYDTSLQRALFGDNMPEAVYRTLVEEVNTALPTLHRYFKLRKRMLGIKDDLRYYDIYPSMVDLEKTYTIEDSIKLTRRALQPLGADYLNAYDKGVQGRWMHVFPQDGKRSGAYMFGAAYDVHPYVLLNHNDDYNSASTFAHEYGHAVHSVLANATQPWETASYATFIAETASIMNEMLLEDLVVKEAQTPKEKLYYLGVGLESLRGTFFRQTMFAEFELKMHEALERGEVLTGEKLTTIYLDLLKRYHGHDEGVLLIDDLYGIEWAFIPHFYSDFYVFQYATSIAAAAGLAERINGGDATARDAFIAMLKAGGSDHPYELMKKTGVDMATAKPYKALVQRMNNIMDEMERLLAEEP